jgi:SAM-dependent methyltransferase
LRRLARVLGFGHGFRVDQNKLSAIAHGAHRFQSPVTPESLDRALAFARLKPGARVFDLGCGHAGISLHLAERYGARVEAVERSPIMAELAAGRLKGRGSPGSVTLHTCPSTEFLTGAEPCDLLIGIGAVQLAAGAAPAEMLRSLAAHVRPGGAVLWGESIWLTEPGEILRQLLGPAATVYLGHAESVGAGEAAGLLPLYATTASEQDWDDYAWRYATAVEDHVAAHPEDPDGPALQGRVRAWRALYLHQARGVMGFGLYLFRKP